MSISSAHYPVAIFASGAGSNARQIIGYFKYHPFIKVALIVCNKPSAGVLQIAEEAQVPTLLIEKERFFTGDAYLPFFGEKSIRFIVLAGFLWQVPSLLINAYPKRIINIHPALLPKFGGKGMYGNRVHNAVISNGEKETGITIHYVDEHYDTGDVIFQATCMVEHSDTAETLMQKVHELEYKHYPQVIEQVISRGQEIHIE